MRADFRTWHGTSKCADARRYPTCRDEQVVYDIRGVQGKTDTIAVVAERLAKQQRQFIGDYRLVRVGDSTWAADIRDGQYRRRLTLRYLGREFAGEIIDVVSGRRVRAITLSDVGGVWWRRISAPESLVVKLYRELAGQVVINNVELTPPDILGESRKRMGEYFDASMIGLSLAERQCRSEKEEALCGLDFDPFWNSQDPTGTQVDVLRGADSTRIGIQLRHAYDGKLDTLTFRMVKTPAGWRIHDVEYSDHVSLATLLRGKPPSYR